MFRLALVSVFLFSFQAFACPDLSGDYICDYGNGETHLLNLGYRTEADVHYYSFEGEEFPADGTMIHVPDSHNYRGMWLRLSCADNLMTLEQDYHAYNRGRYVGHVYTATDMGMYGPQMRMETSGRHTLPDGRIYPVTGRAFCTKR